MVAEVAKVINAAKIRSNIDVYDHYNYPTAVGSDVHSFFISVSSQMAPGSSE